MAKNLILGNRQLLQKQIADYRHFCVDVWSPSVN